MPVLSMFYGIIVRMYPEKDSRHHKPHVHAFYSSDEIAIAIDGEVLEGSLPKRQMKLLDAWMEIHADELYANWELLSNGEKYFKIEPLK